MWWGMSQGKHELLYFCEQEKTKSICTSNHLILCEFSPESPTVSSSTQELAAVLETHPK